MKELDLNNFKTETANGSVVVDFWAGWCGPCRMLAPVLEELAAEKPDVKFCKVNVDEQSGIAAAFGISSIPTVIRFENGKPIARHVGYAQKADLARGLGL